MIRLASLTTLALACAAAAQSITIPNGLAAAEGNSSNAFPWNRFSATLNLQQQMFYDSSHFTGQGVTGPIRITRLRWRANATTATWAGGTQTNCWVDMSTAAFDQGAVTTNMNGNHGGDRTRVYTGNVTFIGGTGNGTGIPGPTVVDLAITPFIYDPTSGNDLCIDCWVPMASWASATGTALDVHTTTPLASRVFNSTNAAAGTITANHGTIVTIDYTPAFGLFPAFTANVTTGNSPLAVSFTDQSYSSAPGGVIAWAWDVDNDTVVDYTTQNPTHTYTTCGNKTVSLTVFDSANPPGTLTKTNYISVDPINAAFTSSQPSGFAPHTVNFTDASTGPVLSWAWDLDGDTITDSTAQNPSWAYGPGTYNVSLTVTNGCFSDTETKNSYVVVIAPGTVPAPPELFQFQFNEVRGNAVANTASAAPTPTCVISNSTWQTDSGRAGFQGNEPGFGCNGYRSTGAAWVNPNWGTNVTGSFSISWWMRKNAAAAAAPFGYAFGNSTFRSFVGGAAVNGVTFRGSSIGNVDSSFTVNGTPGVWQHVALVVNDSTGQALWYSNGQPSTTVVNFTPNTFNYASTAQFAVGAISTGGTSQFGVGYDMDDFRFYTRALSSAELLAISLLPENASSGVFGTTCPGTMGTPTIAGVGQPSVGNLSYAVSLGNAEDSRLAALVLGFTPAAWGSFDISGFLGAGCFLDVPWGVVHFHVTASNGATQALGVPNNSALSGMHVYGQWLIAGTTGATSQALDINIE